MLIKKHLTELKILILVILTLLAFSSIVFHTAYAEFRAYFPYVVETLEVEETTAPEPVLGHAGYDCEQYKPLIEQYDWDTETVIRIMKAESGCYPLALNDNPNTGDFSIGLMQINLYGGLANERPSKEELLIPENNLAFAYKLYSSTRGFGHWSTF